MLPFLIFAATSIFLIGCSQIEKKEENKKSSDSSDGQNATSSPNNIEKNHSSFGKGSLPQNFQKLKSGQSHQVEKDQKENFHSGIIFKRINLVEFNRYKNLPTKPVIAIISAENCPPCENLKKEINSMHDFSGKAEFIEFIVLDEKTDKFAKDLGVKYYPTLLMLKGGSERSRWVGYGEGIAPEIRKKIFEFLKKG